MPLLLALEIGVVLIEGRAWTSELRWAIDWAGAGVFMAGPLAGGIAAWQAQAARRAPGEAAQVAGTPLRLFAFNAGGVLIWAALVHTLVVAGVLVACYQSGLTGWPNPGAIILHWSLLAACVSIGSIVGQFSNSRLLAPLSTVALMVFMIQASNGVLPTLWAEIAGATAPLAGLRYRPEVVLGQLVMFWALALVAVGVTKAGRRTVARFATLGFGVVAAVVAATSLATASQGRFAVVPVEDLARSCFGKSPEVCLVGDTKAFGPQIQRAFSEIDVAAGRFAALPSTYVQVVGSEGPSETHRQFVVDAGMIENNSVRQDLLMRYVVWNRNCLLADEPPPGIAADLISDLAMVLLARMDPQNGERHRLLNAFNALPVVAQDQWIADALEASDSCAFDAIPEWLPTS